MAGKQQRRDKVPATAGKGAAPVERKFSPLLRDCLIIVFFAFVAFLIYSNTLHGPFVFDDDPNIVENPYIRLQSLSLQGLEDAGFEGYARNRPVANISFALNYYVHQYSTTGYHVVNVLIHIITGILLYVFIRETLGIWRKRVSGAWAMDEAHISLIAFSAALLWLVHPIQTQAVSYIVQRMASMSSMFYLASFVLYLRGRLTDGLKARYLLYAGSILSGVLAIGSKENAVTLPFFILLYDWYFFQDLSRVWLKRGLIFLSAALVVFVLAGLFYTRGYMSLWHFIESEYAGRNFTLVERVLTEFRVVVLYLSLLVFPYPGRLNMDYDFSISHSLFNPMTTVFSLGILIGLIWLAIYLAKGHRVFSFCIVWFLGNLVIESSVFGLELVYEHRNYLPSMLVGLVVVLLAYRYVYVRRQWVAVSMLVIVVGVFSLWAYQRNSVWADGLLLWEDCVAKSPQKARPHMGLALVLEDKERLDEAVQQFKLSVQLDPKYAKAYYNLGNALRKQNRHEEAIQYYLKALALEPNSISILNNMIITYGEMGKISESLEYFKRALQIEPRNVNVRYNMAFALKKSERLDEAKRLLLEVLSIDKNHVFTYSELGNIYEKEGKIDEAIAYYRKAIELSPGYAKGHVDLGNVLYTRGRIDEAAEQYAEALRIAPDLVEPTINMGNVLVTKGEIDKAIGYFQRALEIEPGNAVAQGNLGILIAAREGMETAAAGVQKALEGDPRNAGLYVKLGDVYRSGGDLVRAVESYEKALSIEPGNMGALSNLAVVYAGREEYDKALSALKKVIQVQPGSAGAYYNIACIYARQGKLDESVKWLKAAVEKGFADWGSLKQDKDLENIRGTAYYEELMNRRGGG